MVAPSPLTPLPRWGEGNRSNRAFPETKRIVTISVILDKELSACNLEQRHTEIGVKLVASEISNPQVLMKREDL